MASPEETSRFRRLILNQASSNITCYVCLQMKQRKPSLEQDGPAEKCILCNNSYCDKHKSERVPMTCEINHETYCSNGKHKARHAPVCIFRNMREREAYLASNGENNVAGCKDLHRRS